MCIGQLCLCDPVSFSLDATDVVSLVGEMQTSLVEFSFWRKELQKKRLPMVVFSLRNLLLNTYMYAESCSIISPCVLHIQNFVHNHSEHHAIHSTGCAAKKELLDF